MPPANKIGITLGIIAIAPNLIDLNNIKKVILINNKETVASHAINKFSKFQNLEDLYDK